MRGNSKVSLHAPYTFGFGPGFLRPVCFPLSLDASSRSRIVAFDTDIMRRMASVNRANSGSLGGFFISPS